MAVDVFLMLGSHTKLAVCMWRAIAQGRAVYIPEDSSCIHTLVSALLTRGWLSLENVCRMPRVHAGDELIEHVTYSRHYVTHGNGQQRPPQIALIPDIVDTFASSSSLCPGPHPLQSCMVFSVMTVTPILQLSW